MYCDIQQWREIRQRILEQGVPKKRVSAETGISRKTINKMLAHEQPPGHRRRRSRYPKLAPHLKQPPHPFDVQETLPFGVRSRRRHLRTCGFAYECSKLCRHIHNGRLMDRNRAMVALASRRKIPCRTICEFLGVGKTFVRNYRNKFDSEGTPRLFARQTKSNRKIDKEDLRKAIFSLLHEPPTNHGVNRTSWTMALLCRVLKENGTNVGTKLVARIIKAAGYKWRKARIVLTSNDPTYKEKLANIRSILSNLQPDEAFFSIDEYGPFAIKAKPGRTLAA